MLGSQGIVVKCTAAIFFPTVDSKLNNWRNRHTHVLVISDVDECSVDIAACGTGSECVNLNGTFSCQCLVGFEKTGSNCTGLINSVKFTYILLTVGTE